MPRLAAAAEEPAKEKNPYKARLIGVPFIYYSPETKLAFGGGGVVNFRAGRHKGDADFERLGLCQLQPGQAVQRHGQARDHPRPQRSLHRRPAALGEGAPEVLRRRQRHARHRRGDLHAPYARRRARREERASSARSSRGCGSISSRRDDGEGRGGRPPRRGRDRREPRRDAFRFRAQPGLGHPGRRPLPAPGRICPVHGGLLRGHGRKRLHVQPDGLRPPEIPRPSAVDRVLAVQAYVYCDRRRRPLPAARPDRGRVPPARLLQGPFPGQGPRSGPGRVPGPHHEKDRR
ncbi:MAG: hypothetical protein M0C28_39470 [Candidatus Moduliflexus flocculans]|nr:hypothetical protein [Candidatus Moduliflexus flocculans]